LFECGLLSEVIDKRVNVKKMVKENGKKGKRKENGNRQKGKRKENGKRKW